MLKLRNLVPAAVLAAGLLAGAAHAATVEVTPAQSLQAAIDSAAAGDVLRLPAGEYAGPIVIRRPLTLESDAGAVIKGDGDTTVIRVDAPDVTIRGLTVTGSGLKLEEMDAAIFLTKEAQRAVLNIKGQNGKQIKNNKFGLNITSCGKKKK